MACPNSSTRAGSFTKEEAEARRHEIYEMQLSEKYHEWQNPTSGGAVHINSSDEIEVYQSYIKFIDQSPKHYEKVECKDFWSYVSGFGFGNETSVLITSEYDLTKSEVFEEVMEILFKPGIQIYYIKSRTN